MRYRFTQREIEQALDKLVIIVDTREQDYKKYISSWDREQVKFYSIEEYEKFNKKNKVAKKDLFESKLPAGDYSAMLPPNSLKGIERALWFDKATIIEKKGSLSELTGNVSVTSGEYRRLCNEFSRLKANGTKHRILMEDHLYFKHLYEGTGEKFHRYKSQDSLAGVIDKALSKWGTELIPIAAEYMPRKIYSILRNDVRTYLEEYFDIEDMDKL